MRLLEDLDVSCYAEQSTRRIVQLGNRASRLVASEAEVGPRLFTFESNALGGRAVRGRGRRTAGRGRGRHDLFVVLPVRQREPFGVPASMMADWRKAFSFAGERPSCAASCPRRPAIRVS